MRNLFALLVLCGLACTGYAEWGYNLVKNRLQSQNGRLDVLGKRLDELIAKVEHFDSEDLDDTVDDLEHRILHLEGDECSENQFSCGRNSGQCIAEMLACDGHADCDNGHDEEESSCKNPVHPGRAWTGFVDWESCVSRGRDKVTIVITSNKKIEWFPSRIQVGATVALTHEVDGHPVSDAINAVGEYSYGTRKFIMHASDDSHIRIGVICQDAGKNMAKCKFVDEADEHLCGQAILTSIESQN